MARRDIQELIEANLENIEQWTRDGLTMKQIADNLGISDRTLYRHKKKTESQLGQSIKNGRAYAVQTIENSMYNAAVGGIVQTKQYVKLKHCEYENGKKAREWEELKEVEVSEYIKPDTTAGIFLLKNWAKYMNEPATLDIRKKELELKEKQVDANVW